MEESLFYIYDAEDNITRQGVFYEDSLNIDIREGDYKLVIVDKNNPNKILHQQYIHHNKEEPKEDLFLSVADYFGGHVSIICNTYKKGHHQLFVRDASGNVIEEREINGPVINLYLNAGSYTIYTQNTKGVKSEALEIEVIDEDIQSFIELIKNSLPNETEDHAHVYNLIREALKTEERPEPLKLLFSLYKVQEEENIKLAIYDILSKAIKLLNNRNMIINSSYIDLAYEPQPIIKNNGEFTKMYVLEVSEIQGITGYAEEVREDDEHVLLVNEESLYKVEIMNDMDVINTFYFFTPEDKLKQEQWIKVRTFEKELNSIKKRKHLYFNEQIALNEDEKIIAALSNSKDRKCHFISHPFVRYDGENIEFEFSEYEFLRELNKPLFINIKEADLLNRSNEDMRIQIRSSIQEINPIKAGIKSNVDYLFWIEDDIGQIITQPTLFNTDMDRTTSYAEKVREIKINNFKNRLVSAALGEKIIKFIKDTTEYLKTISECTPENIHNILAASSSSSQDTSFINAVSDLALKSYYGSIPIDEGFFNSPIVIQNKRAYFPKEYFDYIIRVDSFSVEHGKVNTYYTRSDGSRIINLINEDYYVLSAINTENYAQSGFVLLNNFESRPILSAWKLKAEVTY